MAQIGGESGNGEIKENPFRSSQTKREEKNRDKRGEGREKKKTGERKGIGYGLRGQTSHFKMKLRGERMWEQCKNLQS